MKKSIYYWSPCLTNIATVKATINSAVSLTKYSNEYNVKIINVCGEWNKYKNYLLEKNVSTENLSFNYYSLLPKNGFLKYRFSRLTKLSCRRRKKGVLNSLLRVALHPATRGR